VLSTLIGWVAYRRAALSRSGAVGAVITGTLIFGFGGWVWGMLLITFFVLSSLLSHYQASTKERLAEKFAKGSRRDLGQVLANGGIGALLALVSPLISSPAMLFAFSGAIATVNADTWATELGVLGRRPPRLITTGQVVEPGTSGGVSLLGTLATLAGGGVIGLAAFTYRMIDNTLGGVAAAQVGEPGIGALLIPAGALGGLAGSLFDSLLGATAQAIYYSEGRHKETERPIDPDGTPNRLIRGRRWLNNDLVNLLSSLIGMLVSAGVYFLALSI
jgi:uncharacterized protein (TIGR00297 family)